MTRRRVTSSSSVAPGTQAERDRVWTAWTVYVFSPVIPWPSHPRLSANGHGGVTVVLTGATGFGTCCRVSSTTQGWGACTAWRSGRPRHVAVRSDKVVEHAGDLSALGLGLSDAEFAALGERADAIIHNGADVSLLKTYPTLRRANVVATRALCEMAIPRRVPLHYVSTASVAKVVRKEDRGDGDAPPLGEVPAAPACPDLLDAVDGYAASKWVSERLLEKAAEDHGLPAHVHRLAHVAGDDASELDAMGMLTKYSLLLRALPRIAPEDVAGQWDFVAVHDVARDLVEAAVASAAAVYVDRAQQAPPQSLRPVFVNHCNQVKTPHSQRREYLEGVAGAPLQEIPMKEWLAAAREKGLHPLVHEFLAAFDEGRGRMVLPGIAQGV